MAKNQKPKTSKAAAADQTKLQKFWAAIKQWFKDLKAEVKKIQWLKGKELWKNCLVVLMVVLVIGIGVWIEDAILVKLRELVFSLANTDAETALIMFKASLGAL